MVTKPLKKRHSLLFISFCCTVLLVGCSFKKEKNKCEIFLFVKEAGGIAFTMSSSGFGEVYDTATLVNNGKDFLGWKALPVIDGEVVREPFFEAGLYIHDDPNEAELLVKSERQFIIEKDSAGITIIEHATGKEFIDDHLFDAGEYLFSIEITTDGLTKDSQ